MHRTGRGFTLIELLVVIAIIGILSSIVFTALGGSRAKGRDANRVSEIRQIRYALELYYGKNNMYPTCLTAGGSCVTALAAAGFLAAIPADPSTGISYSYAGTGSGSNCTGYHLGIALEDKTNPVMLSDADDSGAAAVCTGSNANFHGLSAVAGGVACNTTAGVAQPTGAANGESCYDITQ